MYFPIACCPVCGDRAECATSLNDTYFMYACSNRDCPQCGKLFAGDLIPSEHKAEGEAQLRATVRQLSGNWAD